MTPDKQAVLSSRRKAVWLFLMMLGMVFILGGLALFERPAVLILGVLIGCALIWAGSKLNALLKAEEGG